VTATNLAFQAPGTNSAEDSYTTATNTNATRETATEDIARRYNQGLINKAQAMRESLLAENLQPQDFYGKAIDQYGEPIANANVSGTLILNDGTYGGIRVKNYATITDGSGLFEFVGMHGESLNVRISKEGYKMGERGEGYKGPIGSQTSPTDRATLTMWKIQGAETLAKSSIDARISHDGSPVTFDVATGKESSEGDLRVTLSRLPLDVRRGRDKFNWTAKVEMLNGGVVEENDPYPYLVPENGYQPFFEFNVSSNAVPWRPYLDKDFYIKNSQGQFGLMKLHINSSVTPARLKADFTINPSGSRNLEPDFSK
jgi:hypothetical protein